MRRPRRTLAAGLLLAAALTPAPVAAGPPTWRGQVLDPEVGKVCYAVATADVDGDGKPDVVAVANDAVVWYQNPTWQKRDIIRNATEPDNVCLQPHDVDGDGRVDFALGSAWRPTDTKAGGNLAILTRTGAPEGTWRVVPIASEPTLHRVRWGRVLDSPRPQLVVAPLQGRDTKGPDWGQGRGSRVMVFTAPARPFDEPWPSETITDKLHAVHNLEIVRAVHRFYPRFPGVYRFQGLLAASWEGVFLLHRRPDGSWHPEQIGAGDQESRPNRGTSEVRAGRLGNGSHYLATIEPWHGSKFVAYYRPLLPAEVHQTPMMTRQVVDESLAWGHAIACADLDGDGDDEVVVGQRDPNPRLDPANRGPGVLIYDPKPGPKEDGPLAFDRSWVDMGGVAVEDLIVVDLNGDGRPEIVAGGRATHNVKVYWNEPPAAP